MRLATAATKLQVTSFYADSFIGLSDEELAS